MVLPKNVAIIRGECETSKCYHIKWKMSSPEWRYKEYCGQYTVPRGLKQFPEGP